MERRDGMRIERRVKLENQEDLEAYRASASVDQCLIGRSGPTWYGDFVILMYTTSAHPLTKYSPTAALKHSSG